MSEMELTADHLVVIGQGRLVADMTMREFIEANSQAATLVRSPQAAELAALVERAGGTARPEESGAGPATGRWRIEGLAPEAVGDLAHRHGIVLQELTPRVASLEEVYTRMTGEVVEYRGASGRPDRAAVAGRDGGAR
jgi:ABC-2 type transport system ATP-binding protein